MVKNGGKFQITRKTVLKIRNMIVNFNKKYVNFLLKFEHIAKVCEWFVNLGIEFALYKSKLTH